jgi:carboxypeptidase T
MVIFKGDKMKNSIPMRRCFSLIFILILLSSSVSPVMSFDASKMPSAPTLPEDPVVAVIYFNDRAELDQLAAELDIWEVHHSEGYLIALLSPQKFASLQDSGYRLEIDVPKTALLNKPLEMLPGQVDGIPGYPCYRTVEETYADMESLAAMNPDIAEWIDIGNSWEKVMDPQNGYDIFALVLTNKNIPGPKPTFFLMAAIHAREYTTAELAARFAEFLVGNYGIDPDVTWLLDYFEIHIVPQSNPDGRKIAEGGVSWRKNTDNDDGCDSPNSWGTDLNRNHSFKWDMGGSSDYPCDGTYHGPSAGSEPEVQAIQNYVLTLFPDQRGPGDFDAAPDDATGVFISLHSYSQLVLWPWGWTSTDAPNHAQLRTLGRKFAYFNSYTPIQSYDLYQTSGTSDEWSYGELGIASYTFELGTSFFQSCTVFENTILPGNMPALFYAFKVANTPYMTSYGPDSQDLSAVPDLVIPGEQVQLFATITDHRYGGDPLVAITAAEYFIDAPGEDGTGVPLEPIDGSWGGVSEDVSATMDTTGWVPGQHYILIHGKNNNDDWGPFSAVFVNIPPMYDATLLTENDTQQADPGKVVTYTLEIQSGGYLTDTYDIVVDSLWPASYPTTMGPIPGLGNAAFDIVISVPLSATNGESNAATVHIQSQADPTVSDTTTLTTTANFYALTLLPAEGSKYGVPGTSVTYQLEVTNQGNTSDVFDISSNGVWTATTPSTIGPLDAGQSAAFDVSVHIPDTALPGESDLSTITITSQGDDTKSASSQLTTTAGVLGPLVSPLEITGYGDPGSIVEYYLTITNAGTLVDNFNITVSEAAWDVTAPTSSGLIAPGYSRTIQVTVSIPEEAADGDSDTALIEISSEKPNVVPVSASLTTFAESPYALDVAAETDTLVASQAGDSVTFMLNITNLGNAADTYDLSASSDWTVLLPETVGPLAPGETAVVAVTVIVPVDAHPGDVNATTVTVTSQNDPQVTGQVVLTTRLQVYQVYLPISFKP